MFDAYEGGLIIHLPVLERATEHPDDVLPIHHRAVEEAVLDLIDERGSSPVVEKIAA